jgi:hypothetical protein
MQSNPGEGLKQTSAIPASECSVTVLENNTFMGSERIRRWRRSTGATVVGYAKDDLLFRQKGHFQSVLGLWDEDGFER